MDNRRGSDSGGHRSETHPWSEGHTEIVAISKTDRARGVWALIAVVSLLWTNVGMELYRTFARKPDPLAEAAVQTPIVRSLDQASERAKPLSQEGEHLEAGLLPADIAGAKWVLSANEPPGPAETIGFGESAAGMEFSRIENEEVWSASVAFLKLRYPDWVPPKAGLLHPFPRDPRDFEEPGGR